MPKKEVSKIQSMKGQLRAVNEKLQELQEQTQDYVAENPLKSVVVAFGAGVVAGAVLLKLLERK